MLPVVLGFILFHTIFDITKIREIKVWSSYLIPQKRGGQGNFEILVWDSYPIFQSSIFFLTKRQNQVNTLLSIDPLLKTSYNPK